MALYVQINKKLGKFQLDVEFTMEKEIGRASCRERV